MTLQIMPIIYESPSPFNFYMNLFLKFNFLSAHKELSLQQYDLFVFLYNLQLFMTIYFVTRYPLKQHKKALLKYKRKDKHR